jgi:hypothetical protein
MLQQRNKGKKKRDGFVSDQHEYLLVQAHLEVVYLGSLTA